jgi:UDP-glucose 4-epimerase
MDKVSFEEGIRRMWEWVKQENKVTDWYVWDEFELDKGIYSYWKK